MNSWEEFMAKLIVTLIISALFIWLFMSFWGFIFMGIEGLNPESIWKYIFYENPILGRLAIGFTILIWLKGMIELNKI